MSLDPGLESAIHLTLHRRYRHVDRQIRQQPAFVPFWYLNLVFVEHWMELMIKSLMTSLVPGLYWFCLFFGDPVPPVSDDL